MQMRKIIADLRDLVLAPSVFVDVLFLASIASITYGVSLIYRPGAFIVGGGFGLGIAVLKTLTAKS